MNGVKTAKDSKRRIKGWVIALIIVGAAFATGAICCSIF